MISTTELLVEHIISGILSLVWILAICFSVIEPSSNTLIVIKEYWIIFVFFITAVSYPIGLITDAIADRILDSWDKRIRTKEYEDNEIDLIMMLEKANGTNILNYFTYNRFKIIIARSSWLNFLLIGFSSLLFFISNKATFNTFSIFKLSTVVFLISLTLSIASLFVWYTSTVTLARKARQFWQKIS